MKKARQIIIPEDRPLTWDEFYDYDLHARNSSIWYATEYTRSEQQIIDKLLAKGYIRDDVAYLSQGGDEKSHNIIDGVLETLRENHLVSDESYAKGLINRYSDSKRGASYIRQKLIAKGISSDDAERLLEETRDEDQIFENIEALASRFVETSSYKRIDNSFKQKQKLTSHLLSRGFSFGDIRDWEDQREE